MVRMAMPLLPRLHEIAALGALLLAVGCQQKPTPACVRYVQCQAAWDQAAGHEPKDTSVYVDGGLCWGDATTAAQCGLECEEGTAALRQAAAASQLRVAACE